MVKTRIYTLAKEFHGEPKESDMKIVEKDLPSLKKNEILCEAVCWSVDPYMRSFISGSSVGSPMFGQQVAKIIESHHPDYPVGKHVVGYFGWRTYTIADVTDSRLSSFFPFYILPDIGDLPLSLALGVLGMTGNTAYFGLKEVCKPKSGEIVVVTGAAGAVGSQVGQIARILGCRVIGFTGSDEKVKWLTEELKFDKAYNYRTTNISEALNESAPSGADIYFDNVGGAISTTVIDHMRERGRILICGSISTYNATKGDKNKDNVKDATSTKHLKVEHFAVTSWKSHWQEGIKQNLQWIREGKLLWRETITQGFENMPKAFIGMLRGENIGKAIVKA
ncbi:hypothetical protein L9F63_001807 [Diploptera punctata]|uniref:Prostaglandin reductase 1 n=1 Tax=Diploptera punctata TaxID=6984 RepID=A0AAD8A4K8_DIPPU|nr:hypothetical protein L9F63_001807 [Diploptera punctata]